jgi:hypothetical protein
LGHWPVFGIHKTQIAKPGNTQQAQHEGVGQKSFFVRRLQASSLPNWPRRQLLQAVKQHPRRQTENQRHKKANQIIFKIENILQLWWRWQRLFISGRRFIAAAWWCW